MATATTIYQRRFFLWSWLLFFLTGNVLHWQMGKTRAFYWLNSYHTPALDVFFRWFTYLGDGAFAAVLALILYTWFKQQKQAVTVLAAFLLTGLLVQVIKRLMPMPRPGAFFADHPPSFFINELVHTGYSSFPSGHTTTVFAVATVLAYYCPKPLWQLLYLFLAIGVAFSRVYLSQHFLLDVLAGSLLGVAGSLVVMYALRNISDEQLTIRMKK
jgi:membrane-associated phospholipid phosphatase